MSDDTTVVLEENDEVTLVRTLGFWGSFGMGFADIGADIFVALGVVVAWAMGAAPLSFLLAAVLYACTGLSYTELASTYPVAGGGSAYARKAFGDPIGFIAGWGLLLDYTICIPLFAMISIGYLSSFIPALNSYIMIGVIPIHVMGVVAAILVGFLIVLNYLGIRESATLNIIFVLLCLVGLSFLLLIGFATEWNWAFLLGQVTWGIQPSFNSFLYSVSIATVSFIGLESISEAAEETKSPGRNIPRSTLLLIVCIIFFTFFVSLLAVGIVPWEVIAAGTANPLAVLALSLPFGFILGPFIAIVGITICYVSANSGIVGVSRVSYDMSRSKLLPQWFSKLHSRFRTPHRSIVVFSLVGIGLAFLGDLNFLVDLYAFGALVSYMMVNLSLIRLRNSHPEQKRPWRVPIAIHIPWKNKTEVEVPISAVIGFISCFLVWLIVILFKEFGRLVGILWFIIGIALYIGYRKYQRLPFSTIKE